MVWVFAFTQNSCVKVLTPKVMVSGDKILGRWSGHKGSMHRHLVTQSCPTLCNSMDCSTLDSSICGGSPGKNTGVGCRALLQGIFRTQGLKPGLLHCITEAFLAPSLMWGYSKKLVICKEAASPNTKYASVMILDLLAFRNVRNK